MEVDADNMGKGAELLISVIFWSLFLLYRIFFSKLAFALILFPFIRYFHILTCFYNCFSFFLKISPLVPIDHILPRHIKICFQINMMVNWLERCCDGEMFRLRPILEGIIAAGRQQFQQPYKQISIPPGGQYPVFFTNIC
jgi:hypothetical protein